MTKIIFVSDLYKDQYAGGAELTTEAIIEKCPFPVTKVLSNKLTKSFMDGNKHNYWVFGNFSHVPNILLLHAAKNLNYSVIEYDYKFCKYRLPQLHNQKESVECDCETTTWGKIVGIFFSQAQSLWWMSEAQKIQYHDRFPFLEKKKNYVLSSVFSDQTINRFENYEPIEKNDKWIILGSNSWVKGLNRNIEYAKENNIQYEIVQDLPHTKLLDKLAVSKGLIFLPSGWDTCPRIVIEAKLLECELVLNDHVQHRNETWFQSRESILAHLRKQKRKFWHEISKEVRVLSANFFRDNKYSFACPSYNEGYRLKRFLENCCNLLGLSEVHVVNHRSTDDTEEIIKEMTPILAESGIELHTTYESRDFSSNFTMADLRNVALAGCKNDVVYSIDADWVFGPNFPVLMHSAFNAMMQPNVYAAGHELYSADSLDTKQDGGVVSHGRVYRHVAIPRIVLQDKSICKQIGGNGRYFQWTGKSGANKWVKIPYMSSAVLAMNDKGEDRKNLRATMNKFFELSQKSGEFENKGWLESYEEGLIESEITKEDYYHESHEISVDLIGQEFGSRAVE